MLGWLRSMVFARRAGKPRTAPARPCPTLSLEHLDARSVPSATPVVDLSHLSGAAFTRLARGDTAVASVARVDPGRSGPQTGLVTRAELFEELSDRAAGSVAPPPGVAVRVGTGSLGGTPPGPFPGIWSFAPVLALLRESSAGPEVGLLLDEWKHDPEAAVTDWLAAGALRRPGTPRLAPNQEGEPFGDTPDPVPAVRKAHPPAIALEGILGRAAPGAKTTGLPAPEHWLEATGHSVWVGFRDVLVPDPDPVTATDGVVPATAPGSVPSPRQFLPDGPADAIEQLLPEAAGFLYPAFPFDASVLRAQVARFRDLLEPAVPVIEQCLTADEWWAGAAAAVGVSAGVVVWYRRTAAQARGGDRPVGGGRDRPNDGPDGAQTTVLASPPRRSPEGVEVAGEEAVVGWGPGG